MIIQDMGDADVMLSGLGVVILSGFDDGAAGGTNRLLLENGNGLLIEDSSGDIALES